MASRPGLRVLVTGGVPDRTNPPPSLRSLAGGMLLQEADRGRVEAADLRAVTRRAPSEEEVASMLFAWRIAKHARSNAIVLARGGVTLGIGIRSHQPGRCGAGGRGRGGGGGGRCGAGLGRLLPVCRRGGGGGRGRHRCGDPAGWDRSATKR